MKTESAIAVASLALLICSCDSVSDRLIFTNAEISANGLLLIQANIQSSHVSRLAEDAPMKNTSIYVSECGNPNNDKKAIALTSKWTMDNKASANGGGTYPRVRIDVIFQCKQQYYLIKDHRFVPAGRISWQNACLVTKVSSLMGDRFKASTGPGDLGAIQNLCR